MATAIAPDQDTVVVDVDEPAAAPAPPASSRFLEAQLASARAQVDTLNEDIHRLHLERQRLAEERDLALAEVRRLRRAEADAASAAAVARQAAAALVGEIRPCAECDHPLCRAARAASDRLLSPGEPATCVVTLGVADALAVGQSLRSIGRVPLGERAAIVRGGRDVYARVGDTLVEAARPHVGGAAPRPRSGS